MNRKFLKQLLKFFIPYTLIILFIFSLSSIAYITAFRKIEENELEIQEQYIQQSKSALDNQFKEAFHLIDQLSNTPLIKSFSILHDYDLNKDFSPAMELRKTSDNFQIVNSLVRDYFIFYQNSHVVLMQSALQQYEFLDNELVLYNDLDKDTFWANLFDDTYYKVIQAPLDLRQGHYQILPIKSTISYGTNKRDATLYMQLHSEKIRENMIGYDQPFEGNFFLVDDDQKVLISLNNNYGITENKLVNMDKILETMFTTSARSEVIPYTYVLVQPYDQVFDEINHLRHNGYLFMLAVLLGGLIVSVILARYNTKPFITLMNSNEQLSQRVENQRPYLRMIFMEKWLKGDYVTIEEILSMTRFLKTDYVGNYYCVAVIDYQEHINIFDESSDSDLTQTQTKKLMIYDLLTENLLRPAFIHNLDHSKVAVLFVSDCHLPEALEDIVKDTLSLCDDVMVKANMTNIHYGIGGVYKDMTGVPTSYTEAIDSVIYTIANDKQKVCWFKDIEVVHDICYYPPELESRLYNCIRSGEQDQLVEVLRDLFQKNIVERSLSQQMQQIFIYEMYGTLVKLQQRTFGDDTVVNDLITDALKKIKNKSDIKQIQCFNETFKAICDYYHAKQDNRHILLMKRIDAFINENFHDSDFGLSMIADAFNISYTYLSDIIKEYKDQSFINYLQQLRMDKAKYLLSETDMKVNKIYTQCGYNSSNSFGKAFKRIHGVTASEYREKYSADHKK